jgi:hypothetical protein
MSIKNAMDFFEKVRTDQDNLNTSKFRKIRKKVI